MIINKLILSLSALLPTSIIATPTITNIEINKQGTETKILVEPNAVPITSIEGYIFNQDELELVNLDNPLVYACTDFCGEASEVWTATIPTNTLKSNVDYDLFVIINNDLSLIFNYQTINGTYYVLNYQDNSLLIPIWILVGLVSGFIFLYLINESSKNKK